MTLRKMLPNLVTFSGLICAFSAVLLVTHDQFTIASICILAGYLLDAVDGAVARKLGVASDFGLQLDSLVDIVTFGVAPALLIYRYLLFLEGHQVVMWIVCVGYVIGGVFRLARFNLLPAKGSHSDNVGLTISTSGAVLALSVLSNQHYDHHLFPVYVFPLLVVGLSLLMVSRVRYPSLGKILRRRWLSLTGLGVALLLAVFLSPQVVWLGVTGVYISFGLTRALLSAIA